MSVFAYTVGLLVSIRTRKVQVMSDRRTLHTGYANSDVDEIAGANEGLVSE